MAIGKTNNHFMQDWQKDNGLTDEATQEIIAICHEENVDLGVALNIYQTRHKLTITATAIPSDPLSKPRPNEE